MPLKVLRWSVEEGIHASSNEREILHFAQDD